MLNINGKNDSSYRYKMQPVKSTINGKGTQLMNLDEISNALNHPPILLLNSYLYHLVQFQMKKK